VTYDESVPVTDTQTLRRLYARGEERVERAVRRSRHAAKPEWEFNAEPYTIGLRGMYHKPSALRLRRREPGRFRRRDRTANPASFLCGPRSSSRRRTANSPAIPVLGPLPVPGPCANCDSDVLDVASAEAVEPYPVGARVQSEHWGDGTVQRYDGDQVTVLFDDHGYRNLSVPITVERRLLRVL
jgi:hypothetical protein